MTASSRFRTYSFQISRMHSTTSSASGLRGCAMRLSSLSAAIGVSHRSTLRRHQKWARTVGQVQNVGGHVQQLQDVAHQHDCRAHERPRHRVEVARLRIFGLGNLHQKGAVQLVGDDGERVLVALPTLLLHRLLHRGEDVLHPIGDELLEVRKKQHPHAWPQQKPELAQRSQVLLQRDEGLAQRRRLNLVRVLAGAGRAGRTQRPSSHHGGCSPLPRGCVRCSRSEGAVDPSPLADAPPPVLGHAVGRRLVVALLKVLAQLCELGRGCCRRFRVDRKRRIVFAGGLARPPHREASSRLLGLPSRRFRRRSGRRHQRGKQFRAQDVAEILHLRVDPSHVLRGGRGMAEVASSREEAEELFGRRAHDRHEGPREHLYVRRKVSTDV
mmetsp:Transcript_9540/g.35719  ORF Transcript_9540/g.35719 Transcript_9540/m.35719 type:complete len:384 (-) Transcript_9540:656-1807(-)